MNCSEIQEYLSDFGESGIPGLTVIRDHIEGCPDCLAELARFNELKGALRSLSEQQVEPPSWLEGTLTETIAQKAARQAAVLKMQKTVVQPKVLTGGALVTAGIAGALLFRRRRRRHPRPMLRLRGVLAHT